MGIVLAQFFSISHTRFGFAVFVSVWLGILDEISKKCISSDFS